MCADYYADFIILRIFGNTSYKSACKLKTYRYIKETIIAFFLANCQWKITTILSSFIIFPSLRKIQVSEIKKYAKPIIY